MINLADTAVVLAEAQRRQRLRSEGKLVLGDPAPDPVVATVKPRGQRVMNKTESRRAAELTALVNVGVIRSWAYEAVTLRLADDCRYTPDFLVVDNAGAIRFEETKGFWRDDARVKIKVAARTFPMFSFVALTVRKQRDGGGWTRETF